MTCLFSRSRFRWLRRCCALFCALVGCCSLSPVRAQNLEKPLQSIDEEVTGFAFGPDNRIVYSVYHNLKTKKYDLEHDDIWLQEANGKRHRLLEGQKLSHGNQLFSYLVDSFRFSPSGHVILVQLLMTTIVDDNATDSVETLLLDDSGREARIAKGDNVIHDAANASFLPDNETIAYLSQANKALPLFSLKSTRLSTGSFPSPQEGRTFRDVAWLPRMNFAIAVEQDHAMTGPPRLQSLDLLGEADKELATLGIARWAPDESRILLKRTLEKKSGDLVWIDLPPLAPAAPGTEIPVSQPQPISLFRGVSFREFAISPDGRLLAVVIPGKRNLLIFSLAPR